MERISEVQVTPVKPNNGLIAFCSFVLFESVFCSSVAIFTRPNGEYRLVYPTKKLGSKDLNIFHPINTHIGNLIKIKVINKLNDVMKYDRYNSVNNIRERFQNNRSQ